MQAYGHTVIQSCSHAVMQSYSCTQYTVHSTQYTVHSTQYTVHSTQYTVHSTQYTVHSTQYTVHSTQYTGHSTQYTVHCTLYTVHSSTQCTVHSAQYMLSGREGACGSCSINCYCKISRYEISRAVGRCAWTKSGRVGEEGCLWPEEWASGRAVLTSAEGNSHRLALHVRTIESTPWQQRSVSCSAAALLDHLLPLYEA